MLQCLPTFQGSATVSNPCQCTGTGYNVYWGRSGPFCYYCVSPRYIVWSQNDGNPYCIDPKECYTKLVIIPQIEQEVIINNFGWGIFPNNPDKITGFAQNTTSQVTPVSPPGYGFAGRNFTLEYIFGFGAASGVTQVLFRGLFTDPNKNVTCFNFVLTEYDPEKQKIINNTFTGCARFDENNEIIRYDAVIPWLNVVLDITNVTEQAIVIENICTVHEYFCVGPLQQYANYNVCIDTLTNKVPFGSFGTSCYILHTTLIVYLPVVGPQQHCPHIGPNSFFCNNNWPISGYYNFYPPGKPSEYIVLTQ